MMPGNFIEIDQVGCGCLKIGKKILPIGTFGCHLLFAALSPGGLGLIERKGIGQSDITAADQFALEILNLGYVALFSSSYAWVLNY